MWFPHGIQNWSCANAHPHDRAVPANEALLPLKRCALLEQAIIEALVFFQIIQIGERPQCVSDQFRFRKLEHVTESLIHKDHFTFCIRSYDTGCRLIDNGTEALL